MITKARRDDAFEIARLHYDTITEGFLRKLGLAFLESMYQFIIEKELVIVYKLDKVVVGFVSCSYDSKGIMKKFLLSSPMGLLKLVRILLKEPRYIYSLFETVTSILKNGRKPEEISPKVELLSISVSPHNQNLAIGSKLIEALEKELLSKKIDEYKVVAGDALIGANKFYLKNGFCLSYKVTIHGNSISNVYIKKII